MVMKSKHLSPVLVSQSDLPFEIESFWRDGLEGGFLEDVLIDEDSLYSILTSLRTRVRAEARSLAKSVKSFLQKQMAGGMYRYLLEDSWFKAACVVEVFRHYRISKNAGDLDTFGLQEIVLHAIRDEDSIKFSIAWGQAKRPCGGLKTEGSCADFSELYAIAVLQIVASSVSELTDRDVIVKVMSGGDRFASALFGDPVKNDAYDVQRATIAEYFRDNRACVCIERYKSLVPSETKSVNEYKVTVDPVLLERNFKTVLLNIDWDRVLGDPGVSRHSATLPEGVVKLLNDGFSKNELIKMGVIGLINRSSQCFWIDRIGDAVLFDEILDYFSFVAAESTREYISIHMVGSSCEAGRANKPLDDGFIRLTVHVKHDKPHVPALYTLGKAGGNRLSQHVCAFVSDNGLLFGTIFEMRRKGGFRRVVLKNDGGMFGWLSGSRQPLMYCSGDVLDFRRRVASISFLGL